MMDHGKDLPLGFLINTVGRLIFEETQRQMDGMHVEVIELGVLWLVDAYPGCQQSDYAQFQRRDATTFGRYADKLERKGLLVRKNAKDDRRAHALFITQEGAVVLAEGRARAETAQEAVIGPKTAQISAISKFMTDVLAAKGGRLGTTENTASGENELCDR